jgi:hypothetical protein
MRYVRFLAFGLAALAAAGSAGCWHCCGCNGTPSTASGYYSPCCGTPGASLSGPVPAGIPTSGGPGAPCPTCPNR